MKNAVGREIPEEILKQTGKEPFQGNNYKDGVPFRRMAPIIRPVMDNQHSKLVENIHEALVKCKAHNGMTVSFHHHFREGDLVVCMVMREIHKMGLKNITLAATSLGKAHDELVPMIEDGTITRIEASGVRGKIGEAISHGKLQGLAIMRSHGGRVRSLVTGAQGGHPDTAQGAKCTIVICPLLQGRIPAICSEVTTVTTPGESVDIVVTDYGVAVNPNRHDLLDCLKKADCVPLKSIEELRDIAYSITGEPQPVEFADRVAQLIPVHNSLHLFSL